VSGESRPVALTRLLGAYPADLSGTCLVALACALGIWTMPPAHPVRIALAVPLIVFLPGYALTGALFPRGRRDATDPDGAWLDPAERAGLSLGLGLGLAAVVGVLLGTHVRLDLPAVSIAYLGVTVLGAQVGALRRLRVDDPERYRVPAGEWFGVVANQRGANRAAAVLLAVAVVAAIGSLALGIAAPHTGSSYTGLALLGADEDTTADVPDTVPAGESLPVAAQVNNHEGRPVGYTLVVQAQQVSDGGVTDREELARVERRVQPGESARIGPGAALPASRTGQRIRVAYLLYRGDPPATAAADSAYREAYVWVQVGDSSG